MQFNITVLNVFSEWVTNNTKSFLHIMVWNLGRYFVTLNSFSFISFPYKLAIKIQMGKKYFFNLQPTICHLEILAP